VSAATDSAERLAAIRAAARKTAGAKHPGKTYFLLLSSHERGGRRFVRLSAASVLAWFQQALRKACVKGDWEAGLAGLRGEVYGLDKLFVDAVEEDLACPVSDTELAALLRDHIYYERDIEVEPHFVHVETDDDEVNIEYYFFDDDFLESIDALDHLPSLRYSAEVDDENKEDDDDPYARLLQRVRRRAAHKEEEDDPTAGKWIKSGARRPTSR